jgi:cell division septation protein DedD
LIAAALAALAALPVAAQSVRCGIEAWQKADYATAVSIWRPLADAGNSDASFNLGQAYRLGRGVPQDPAQAQGWYERAARNGHLNAQATLGLMLFETGNRIAGLRWIGLAADRGEPRAMLIYGTALFNGIGMPRDPLLGYVYVKRSAASGFGPAKDTLAEIEEILPEADQQKALALAVAKPAKDALTPSKAAPVATDLPAASVRSSASRRKTPPAAGPWRIQLGAFSRRSSAEALYKSLAGKAALAGRTPYYVAVGAVTRLQIGPYPTSGAAQAACAALPGIACFPTLAK